MSDSDLELTPSVRPTLIGLNAEVTEMVAKINRFVDDDFEYQEKTRVWENMKAIRKQNDLSSANFMDRCKKLSEAYIDLIQKYESNSKKYRKKSRRFYESTKRKYESLAVLNEKSEILPADEWEIPYAFPTPDAVKPARNYERSAFAVKMSRISHNNKYRYHSRAHLTVSGAQKRIHHLTDVLKILSAEQRKRHRQWKQSSDSIANEGEAIEMADRKLDDAHGQQHWITAFEFYRKFIRNVFKRFQAEELVRRPGSKFSMSSTWAALNSWSFRNNKEKDSSYLERAADIDGKVAPVPEIAPELNCHFSSSQLKKQLPNIETWQEDKVTMEIAEFPSAATWTEGVLKNTFAERNRAVRQPFGVYEQPTKLSEKTTRSVSGAKPAPLSIEEKIADSQIRNMDEPAEPSGQSHHWISARKPSDIAGPTVDWLIPSSEYEDDDDEPGFDVSVARNAPAEALFASAKDTASFSAFGKLPNTRVRPGGNSHRPAFDEQAHSLQRFPSVPPLRISRSADKIV